MTINNEHTKNLKKAFFAIVVALSAMTTFMFFFQHFVFMPEWDAWANGVIGGLMGIAVLDFGALTWLKIYLSGCDNNSERSFAVTGFGIDMIGSAITTLLQLMTSTNFVDLPPDITTYSVVAIAFVVVANFVLVAMYTRNTTQAKTDEQQSALVASGLDEAMKLAKEMFEQQIPNLAAAKADQMVREAKAQFLQMSPIDQLPPNPQITAATGGKMDVGIVANSGKPEYTPDAEIDPNFT